MTENQSREAGCLVGWKKIALFFDSSTSTVKRWHKDRKMPISYTPGGAPAAFPEDLRGWLKKSS